jgi:phage RecT family recombinase
MPSTDLVVFERELTPLAPHFTEVLAGVMPVERLMRTAVISAERNPYLLKCNRQSFLNTIMSSAVLGLEMDGVTGQAFPIPFKGKVQLVIGYKGYVTLGARAGLTIDGQVVREGDEFDYELGTNAFVRHKPKLGNKAQIIGAWAMASAPNRTPVVCILGIDEILDIKAKSPAGDSKESPWNNHEIGFPAMASKSAKRRLCRSLPLNVMQLAARMEEAFDEQGRGAFITPDKNLIVEGEVVSPITERTPNETPEAEMLMAPREVDDGLKHLREQGHIAAKEGTKSLQIWFGDLKAPEKKAIKAYLDTTLKPEATKADSTPAQGQMQLNSDDVSTELEVRRRKIEAAKTKAEFDTELVAVNGYLCKVKRTDLLAPFVSSVKAVGERLDREAAQRREPAELNEF